MGVTEDAILKVRELIVEGKLHPGERLPPEKELAAQLGLSRSSLREAVRALSVMRVFDARQGDGTYVTSLEPEDLLDFLSFVVDLVQDDRIHEIFELRRLLEPPATALAAQRVTDEDIEALTDCLERFDRATGWAEMLELDLEFHDRIMAAARNTTLRSLSSSLSQHTVRARIWRGMVNENVVDWTRQQHQAILRALTDRDAPTASAAAYVHVVETERWLRRYLAEGRDGAED